jgi:hypothetical protein
MSRRELRPRDVIVDPYGEKCIVIERDEVPPPQAASSVKSTRTSGVFLVSGRRIIRLDQR